MVSIKYTPFERSCTKFIYYWWFYLLLGIVAVFLMKNLNESLNRRYNYSKISLENIKVKVPKALISTVTMYDLLLSNLGKMNYVDKWILKIEETNLCVIYVIWYTYLLIWLICICLHLFYLKCKIWFQTWHFYALFFSSNSY